MTSCAKATEKVTVSGARQMQQSRIVAKRYRLVFCQDGARERRVGERYCLRKRGEHVQQRDGFGKCEEYVEVLPKAVQTGLHNVIRQHERLLRRRRRRNGLVRS